MRILLVDDEPTALRTVTRLLRRHGLRDVDTSEHGGDAVEKMQRKRYDLVLLDVIMPEMDGLEVLRSAKPQNPSTEFIMVTAMDDLPTAVTAIRLGAYDYLVKPVEPDRLLLSIRRAHERRGLLVSLPGPSHLEEQSEVERVCADIVTQDLRTRELLAYAVVMARGGNPILITGDSGTGKELLARAIHRAGPDPEGPFVAVNVPGVPTGLFEGAFFGYAKGAFTGADKEHVGYFERADGGTLFLDEIGELRGDLQAKLLRVLEEKTVSRLGDAGERHVSFRVVSATNKDLDRACAEGGFRLDLLYRLKSVHIHLPALKERKEDIPLLATHFLRKYRERHRKDVQSFSPEALQALMERDYPGNIRELAQLIEKAVVWCDGTVLLPRHMGLHFSPPPLSARTPCTFKENDETHLAFVLGLTRGDTRKAAEILGVTVRQVQRKASRIRKDPRWRPFLEGLGGPSGRAP